MSSTAMFVEILIIGIQTAIGITICLITCCGSTWISEILIHVKNWESLITIILLAIIYTVGIIVDRIGDSFFLFVNPKRILQKNLWIQQWIEQAHTDIRIKILAQEGQVSTLIDYIRSRIRILRATSLNIVMITISIVAYIVIRLQTNTAMIKWGLVVVIITSGSVLFLITVITWGMLELTYSTRLKQAEDELQHIKK